MVTNFEQERIGKITQEADNYRLELSDFVTILRPPDGLQIEEFNPHNYFITSGDAHQKTEQLDKDIFAYAGRVRSLIKHIDNPTAELIEFENKCWKTAGSVRTMKNAIIKARGKAVFMETEWINGVLTCTPKNPRPRKD